MHVTVFDLSGRRLGAWTYDGLTLDISHLGTGVYLLQAGEDVSMRTMVVLAE